MTSLSVNTLQKKSINSFKKYLKEYNLILENCNKLILWDEKDTEETLKRKLSTIKDFNFVKYTNILQNSIKILHFILKNPDIYDIGSASLYEWSKFSSKSSDLFSGILKCIIGKTIENCEDKSYITFKINENKYLSEIVKFIDDISSNLSEYIRLYKSQNIRDSTILNPIANNLFNSYYSIHQNFEKLNNFFMY
tara:strand:+ start:3319 stop:3900 length:582 start_codon:yes stop_codon:yes gene_type:complete